MTQISIDYQVNPRFVPGDVPLWLGNAKDSALIYDATASELSLQTQNASGVLTDRIRVESGTETPFVEFAAGRLRLLDSAADPAVGEITRNGADVKVYSGGAVRNLTDIAAGGFNVVEDTTPQLGGDLDMQANKLVGNGGSTGIAISANGEVTMASQPSFLAHNTGTDANVTGNGASATVDFDTEIFDQNADFASDTFTAPVTGKYLLTACVRLEGITGAADQMEINFTTSNRSIFTAWRLTNTLPDRVNLHLSMLVDMDAADTATVVVVVTGEVSDVVDVVGQSSMTTFFSGHLVA